MFAKSLDEIVAGILTDYRNIAGIEPGVEVQIRASMLGSAVFGLLYNQDKLLDEFFPGDCTAATLRRHAWISGIVSPAGESTESLLNRYLSHHRSPPAGGNATDHERWAKECLIDEAGQFYAPDSEVQGLRADVLNAWCYPCARGLGTVDMVIQMVSSIRVVDFQAGGYVAADALDIGGAVQGSVSGHTGVLVAYDNSARRWWVRQDTPADVFDQAEVLEATTGQGTSVGASKSEVAYPDLVLAVNNYIVSKQAIGGVDTETFAITPQLEFVDMTVSGDSVDIVGLESDIAAHMNGLVPGNPTGWPAKPASVLYQSQLTALAVNRGADSASIALPAADVVPVDYAAIRPASISVVLV